MAGVRIAADNYKVYDERSEKPSKIKRAFKATLLNPNTANWIGDLGGSANAVNDLAKSKFKALARFGRAFMATQLLAIFNAPFDLYEVIISGYNLITEKGKQKRIDNALDLTAAGNDVIEDVLSITSGLNDLKPFASGLKWFTPLTIISTALSVITLPIEGRNLYYAIKHLKKLGHISPESVETYAKKHSYHLERQCGIDRDLIKAALKKNESWTPEGQNTITKHVNAMKGRIRAKIACISLSAVATIIGIISTVILLTAILPHFAMVVAGLTIAICLCGMTRRAIEYISEKQLERKLIRA